MKIELFGLPGSGKTYLSKIYTKRYNLKFINLKYRKERIKCFFLFIIKNKILFFYLIFELLKENIKNFKIFKHKLFLCYVMLSRECYFLKYDNYIIDEGIVQFMYTIYDRVLSENEIRNKKLFKIIFKYIEKNNITLIKINSDKKRRFERMEKRKRFPREKFGKNYSKNILNIAEKNDKNFEKILHKKINKIIQN